jgi:hypothetical protein
LLGIAAAVRAVVQATWVPGISGVHCRCVSVARHAARVGHPDFVRP